MVVDRVAETDNRVHVAQLNNASYASLTSRAITDTAHGIVDRLIECVEGMEEYRKSRRNKRSEKSKRDLRRAFEGFVGDLLRAYNDPLCGGWVYRSLKPASFTGEAVSYRTFLTVLDALGGSLEKQPGYQQWSEGFEPGSPKLFVRGKATRFRATPSLAEYCAVHGLDVADAKDHFIPALPEHPLVLKRTSTTAPNGDKVRGRPIKFERAARPLKFEQQVRDLNEFFDRFDLRGGSHRGYVRIFNQGDHPRFDWNMGGRLYSQGDDSYQRLKQAQRLRMTINGDPVCEIDIRASYLTIYHAHHGAPLDTERDPYELPGLPLEARGMIKSWFVATFGNNGPLERWPSEIAAQYREREGGRLGKRYPVKVIRSKAIERYPLLERWGSDDIGWADLMFIESQAMIGAMIELTDMGVPSLSVHDSLIVSFKDSETAQEVLRQHYLKKVGALPALKVRYTEPAEPETFEASAEEYTEADDDFQELDAEDNDFSDSNDHSVLDVEGDNNERRQSEDNDEHNDCSSSHYF